MRVIVLNVSAFRNSVVEGFCGIFEDICEKEQIETIRLNLHAEKIPVCVGSYTRPEKLSELHELVLASDGLFIATPCHWFNVPGVLKNFIDHLTCIDVELWEKTRVLCVAVYSPEGGEYGALASCILPLNLMGFTLPGNGYAYFNGGDRWVYPEIEEMPKRMKEIISN